MLKFAIVIWIVLWSSLAEAIKWDFDDGTTQGWTAKEALTWGGRVNSPVSIDGRRRCVADQG